MANEEERDSIQTEWERQQREKEEANRQFTDALIGAKDALEHMAIEATFNGLLMRGFVGQVQELRGIKHRTNCPGCMLIRDATRMPKPDDLIQAAGVMGPTGPSLRGLRRG